MALTSRCGKLVLSTSVEPTTILLLHLLHARVVLVEAEGWGWGRGPASTPC